jgi:hypothetical protein
LAIEVHEAKDRGITCLRDYEKYQPGRIDEIKAWFKYYKTWEGQNENKFVWNGEVLSADKAM